MLALLNALLDMKASPDEISYSATIAACGNDSWQNALSVFQRMREQEVLPDIISFSSAAHACGAHGRWQQAFALCCCMRQQLGREPNAVMMSSMISACGASKEWQRAFALLAQMQSDTLQMDVFVYGAAINACEEAGLWEEAVHLLGGMITARVLPNNVCFNAAISACDKGGQWELGLDFLFNLQSWKVKADAVSCGAAISACAQCHQWRAALTLLDGMTSMRIRRNAIAYTSALSGLEKAGHWEPLLLMLAGMSTETLQPTLASYGAAMSACESVGAWAPALSLLQGMKSQRLVPTGLIAGSLAGAVHQGLCKKAALDILEELRGVWVEQSPEATCAMVPADGAADLASVVVGWSPGVVAALKPSGSRTEELAETLAEYFGCELALVSRLDHPTSGVLPMAFGPEGSVAANWLQAQFAARMVYKEYLCLVEGSAVGGTGFTAQIDAALQTFKRGEQLRTEVSSLGRDAQTEYQVLGRYRMDASTNEILSFLSVRPRTGRTHQIRVHMASIGAPIVGDQTYGMKKDSVLPWCGRLFLHCHRIRCKDLSGHDFEAEAPLPAELEEVLRRLQKAE
ncbi:unnamed protein product [Symbiodinium natans]|uniref:Pseudouridine synthase RsuA/RluA-like domain-containing protein n=1 Tax=Symbiodinium natans TaxID=878477 RepID=A0A812T9X6_9DINO|nr:unnamed protein product [Symbiodinium natans]